MRIEIVTPAPGGTSYGNRITAVRWANILRRFGHRVTISQTYTGRRTELLIALHARRSYQSIKRFAREHPNLPIVIALTGTDVYHDLKTDSPAERSLRLATRIVALQPNALERLLPGVKAKARIIYQSAPHARRTRRPSSARGNFDVCVIAHLRPVKDPFRAALAARLLPASSRIRILQIGAAMTPAMATQAEAEARRNPRYRWLGELSRTRAQRYLLRSQLCVVSSRMEGGANVRSEAIVAGVPILASRIDGNTGVLGNDYPGLFEPGNTQALANLLHRAETDLPFLNDLRRRIRSLTPLFNPQHEHRAWAQLIRELQGPCG